MTDQQLEGLRKYIREAIAEVERLQRIHENETGVIYNPDE